MIEYDGKSVISATFVRNALPRSYHDRAGLRIDDDQFTKTLEAAGLVRKAFDAAVNAAGLTDAQALMFEEIYSAAREFYATGSKNYLTIVQLSGCGAQAGK